MSELLFICARCRKALDEPGGILLTDPGPMMHNAGFQVTKFHLCRRCCGEIVVDFFKRKEWEGK